MAGMLRTIVPALCRELRLSQHLHFDPLNHQPSVGGWGIAEALLVRLGKGCPQTLQGRLVRRTVESDEQSLLRGHIPEFQVDSLLPHRHGTTTHLLQGSVGQGQLFCDQGRQPGQAGAIEGLAHRHLTELTRTGLPDPIGREHPGQGMQQHLAQPEGCCHATGQLAGRTAVGNQDAPADVMTAEQRHLTDGCRHGLNREVEGTLRQNLRCSLQRFSQNSELLLRDRQVRMGITIRTEHRREGLSLQPAQQQMGIGDGEGSTPAVTGRAWIRSCRAGPHQHPATIVMNDRASTGSHRVNRQSGCREQQTGDLRFGAAVPVAIGRPRRQAEHISARASHIQANQGEMPNTGLLGRGHSTDHAARRPRQDGVLGQQRRWGLQTSTGGHHPQPGVSLQRSLHLVEIGHQNRTDGGFYQGGLAPGNQSGQRAHLVGTDHRLKASGEHGLRQGLFMGRRPPGMHQGDGTTAQTRDAMGPQPADESGIDHQRLQLAPRRIQTSRHLLNRRDQGGRQGNLQSEEVPPVLITDAQQVGQALVREQQHWLPLAFKQGIGGHGGSQSHLLDA